MQVHKALVDRNVSWMTLEEQDGHGCKYCAPWPCQATPTGTSPGQLSKGRQPEQDRGPKGFRKSTGHMLTPLVMNNRVSGEAQRS